MIPINSNNLLRKRLFQSDDVEKSESPIAPNKTARATTATLSNIQSSTVTQYLAARIAANTLSQTSSSSVNDRFLPSRQRTFEPSTYFEINEPSAPVSVHQYRYQKLVANALFGNIERERVLKNSESGFTSRPMQSSFPKEKNARLIRHLDQGNDPVIAKYVFPLATDSTRFYFLYDGYISSYQHPFSGQIENFTITHDLCSLASIPKTDLLICGTTDGIVNTTPKDHYQALGSTVIDIGGQICVLKPRTPQSVYVSSDSGILCEYDLRTKDRAWKKQVSTNPIIGITYKENQVALGLEHSPWVIYDPRFFKKPLHTGKDTMTHAGNLVFSKGNQQLLATAEDKIVRIWDTASELKNLHSFGVNEAVTSIDWSDASGNEVQFTYGEDGTNLEFWALPTRTIPWLQTEKKENIMSKIYQYHRSEYDPSILHFLTKYNIAIIKVSK